MKGLSSEMSTAMLSHSGHGVQTRRAAQEEGRVMPESDDMIVPKLSTEALLCLHTAAEEFVKGFMFDSNVGDAAGYPPCRPPGLRAPVPYQS